MSDKLWDIYGLFVYAAFRLCFEPTFIIGLLCIR